MGFDPALNVNSIIASTLLLAVKLLWIAFVLSLVIGLILTAKKYFSGEGKPGLILDSSFSGYKCPCCGTKLTAEFQFCPRCKASLKDICVKCGKNLQVSWKCCPLCGMERKR